MADILLYSATYPPVHHFDGSEHRAWASSLGLLGLLNQLNNGPDHGKVRMMAHSMGNVVAGEALHRAQSAQVVHTDIASQAAIAAHSYDVTAPLMGNNTFGFGTKHPTFTVTTGKTVQLRSHISGKVKGVRVTCIPTT